MHKLNSKLISSELEQIQNEKRKSLLEHETVKLRECDDALQRDLREWKSKLLPRKQVNFEQFFFYFIFIFTHKYFAHEKSANT